MTNLNPIKKKLTKENRKVSVQDPSKLLAEFFNGVVIKLDEEYTYASVSYPHLTLPTICSV